MVGVQQFRINNDNRIGVTTIVVVLPHFTYLVEFFSNTIGDYRVSLINTVLIHTKFLNFFSEKMVPFSIFTKMNSFFEILKIYHSMDNFYQIFSKYPLRI